MITYEFESDQYTGQMDDSFEVIYKQKKLPLLYRISGRERAYFTVDDTNGAIVLYNSGTTCTKHYVEDGENTALDKWRQNLIAQGINPNDVLVERQRYGSLLHHIYGRIFQGETASFSNIVKFIEKSGVAIDLTAKELTAFITRNKVEFSKDIASFMQWVHDHEVEPLAIELMLKSDEHCVATPIDSVCRVTVKEKGYWGEVYKSGEKKGTPKETFQDIRKTVIVDYKSGKAGFFTPHILQLMVNELIYNENFPDTPIEGIYNFAPKAWTGTTPTYRFDDQGRSTIQHDLLRANLHDILRIGRRIFESKITHFCDTVIHGDIKYDKTYTSSVESLSLYDIAALKYLENKLQRWVSSNNLTTDTIESFLRSKSAKYCEDLAKELNITYKTKPAFITHLLNQYLNG